MTIEHVNVESWGKLFTKVGGYGLIAGWLIYQLGTDIKVTTRDTLTLLQQQAIALQQHTNAGAALTAAMQSLVNLQLQQCANNASNRSEHDACFDALNSTPTSRR